MYVKHTMFQIFQKTFLSELIQKSISNWIRFEFDRTKNIQKSDQYFTSKPITAY